MTQRTQTLAVCLPAATASRIRHIATQRVSSPSAVLRELVHMALPFSDFLRRADLVRLAANIEYLQAAEDFRMSRDFPREAEQLPSLVLQRMATHHGYEPQV